MHEHLGLQLNGPLNAPPTPPSTQNAVPSGPSSSTQQPTAGSSSTDANNQGAPRATPSQPLQAAMQQPVPHFRQQPVQQQAATIALPAGPNAPHAQNPPPAQPADEIATLRARIAELERGSAHGNQLPARATVPHQALVADPTAVNRIRANLASAKDEPKKLTLPALQPGHKVSALSLRESFLPSYLRPFRFAPGVYRIRFRLAPALLECPVAPFCVRPSIKHHRLAELFLQCLPFHSTANISVV